MASSIACSLTDHEEVDLDQLAKELLWGYNPFFKWKGFWCLGDHEEVDLDQLAKELFWGYTPLYKWKGFWCLGGVIKNILAFQSHFQARSDDIILASSLKTRTTWLKALCVSILERDGRECDDGVESEKSAQLTNKLGGATHDPYPIEKAFDQFCEGVHPLGPYFDHVLEYWLESLKMPDKILFLKYEDLKRDPKEQVKKLAAFLGRPLLKDDDVEIQHR
ncbi:hypothetical protein JRO89_XS14G0043700 [Xanthoceras sorbifolium]|uniref:Sulfotransferase n=1 Tax=Xanthoceras sorbifolium TaxID=99658 RepID=A0ABQ8H3Q5_9ROSI|nr:hypothetical protein JRO89_XS14G0043700 [Xanthoceras sorbifolium]